MTIMRLRNAQNAIIEPRYLRLYVAPNGSDSNSGTSSSAPLATIAKALEMGATRIILAKGTYTEHPSISSKRDLEIICPYWDGTATFEETRESGSSSTTFTISNCQNIRFVNITVTGGDLGCIYVTSCDNILFERCGAHNSMRGMGFKVEASTVYCSFCKANGNKVDGFNLHEGGYLVCTDCLADSNEDDGFSNHANTQARYIRCIAIRNGDGISPVSGAETMCVDCASVSNTGKGFQFTADAQPNAVLVAGCAAYDNGTNWSVTNTDNIIAYNNINGTNGKFENLETFD